MATTIDDARSAAPPRRGYRADQPFFTRLAIVLALLIVLGFAQFALRGFVDYRGAPLPVHFHGAVMLSWLALFVTQNRLIETGRIETHRRLGRVGAILALLVAGTASYVGYAAIVAARQPPFFEPAYFLALTQLGALFFLGLVVWAVLKRRETEWHRRLMFASLIAIMEPAFGRLLPMPLMMPWGEWAILAVQLGMFAVLMRHDSKALGAVHPATLAGAGVVTLYHVLIETLARVGPFVDMARALGPAG